MTSMTRFTMHLLIGSLVLMGCRGEDPAVQKAREQLPPNFKLTMGESEDDKPADAAPAGDAPTAEKK